MKVNTPPFLTVYSCNLRSQASTQGKCAEASTTKLSWCELPAELTHLPRKGASCPAEADQQHVEWTGQQDEPLKLPKRPKVPGVLFAGHAVFRRDDQRQAVQTIGLVPDSCRQPDTSIAECPDHRQTRCGIADRFTKRPLRKALKHDRLRCAHDSPP